MILSKNAKHTALVASVSKLKAEEITLNASIQEKKKEVDSLKYLKDVIQERKQEKEELFKEELFKDVCTLQYQKAEVIKNLDNVSREKKQVLADLENDFSQISADCIRVKTSLKKLLSDESNQKKQCAVLEKELNAKINVLLEKSFKNLDLQEEEFQLEKKIKGLKKEVVELEQRVRRSNTDEETTESESGLKEAEVSEEHNDELKHECESQSRLGGLSQKANYPIAHPKGKLENDEINNKKEKEKLVKPAEKPTSSNYVIINGEVLSPKAVVDLDKKGVCIGDSSTDRRGGWWNSEYEKINSVW